MLFSFRECASAISISPVGGDGNASSNCESERIASLAVTKLSAWRLCSSSSCPYSSSIYASVSFGSDSALAVIVGIVATVDFLGRKGGPAPFTFMF
jgi:hypothetical protein